MKKAKTILSALLVIIMCISICGCSNTESNQTAEKPQQENALITIDTKELGDIRILSADSNDKYTALFYVNYIGEIPEDTPEEEIPELYYSIALLDTKSGKVIKTSKLDNPDGYSYKLSVTDDISLFNEMKGEMISFDFNLGNKVVGSYIFEENWESGEKAGLDTGKFVCQDGFAVSTSFDYAQTIVFYDNPEEYYVIKNNIYYEFNDKIDKSILLIDNQANTTDKPESILKIFDFENQKEINSVKIPNNLNYNNIALTSYGKYRVTVVTDDEFGKSGKIFVWNYNLNPTNKKFENGYCEKVTKDQLDDKIHELEARINIDYGITLECNANKNFLKDEYKFQNDYDKILVYQKALDLEYFLSLLPENIFNEIICADLENPVSRFDDFRIYLVGTFEENIDAFAGNIGCDETNDKNIVYITYSCNGLNRKTFFHEFMHTFEYRIWNYEVDFYDKWLKLNPKKFDYTEDYTDLFYDEKHSDFQEYFTRDYGMKNMLEDKATCFEELCEDYSNDNVWWQEKPYIVAKEKYLAEVLEKSFPCFENSQLLKANIENKN